MTQTERRTRRRWVERSLVVALLIALALLAGTSTRKDTTRAPVSTTTPPMPITGPTTVQYSLRVAVTQAMNAVADAGRFVPTLKDLVIPGAENSLDEDANGDGYDDDGRLEMTREDVTLCLTLPSETGARYLSIVDGSCA